jgi:tRNA(Ile)-lysidine synthase
MEIYQQVEEFIRKERLLQPGQRLVVGVSGGPDSLCLLDCLHNLGYRLVVAHLDHQLRPESPDEAAFVQRTAKSYGLQVIVGKEDVRSMAGAGSSLEEAARLARYRFLVQVARSEGLEVIATGHTADDQAETVLMHFLRGAGPSGLRGMLPATSLATWVGIPDADQIVLVRPLLSTTRKQTYAHCLTIGLEPMQDPSNLDLSFFRNRLRHHLLPMLETYNPGIYRVLNRTGRVMAAEAELVAALVDDCWPLVIRPAGEGAWAIRSKPFLQHPIALQRAILREAIAKLRPSLRDVGFDTVERALSFIKNMQRGKYHALTGDLELLHLSDEVILRIPGAQVAFPQLPQLTTNRRRRLKVPGRMRLAGDWSLKVSKVKLTRQKFEEFLDDSGGRRVAFDERLLKAPLAIRPPKSGDRIRPLGMHGSMKVANLFVNRHIPQPARARWPLIVSGDEVLWVAGLHMSDDVRLTKDSKQAVVLTLIAHEEEVAS